MKGYVHWVSISSSKAPVRFCAECNRGFMIWDKHCKHERAAAGKNGEDTRKDDPLSKQPGYSWMIN